MSQGSCGCGAIQVSVNGPPLAIALCHCTGCQKLSGAPFSYNYILATSQLKLSGTASPKATARLAESGNKVRNYFCPECGSPIFGGTLSPAGTLDTLVLRAGVLDDLCRMEQGRPAVEIYTSQRLAWIPPVPEAKQFEGMLPASAGSNV